MSKFNQFSALIIEQISNRILKLDAEANDKLKDFKDKVIHIQISDFNLNFYFLFPNATLIVLDDYKQACSASITGKSGAFIAAATNSNSSDAIFSGELNFSGEINTARRFQEFIQSLEIDWQEPLSLLLGDIASQNISQAIGQFNQFIGQFVKSTKQDIPEYLQHEIQVTPNQSEINYFLEQVDLTRSQADRLKARFDRLQINL